MFFGIPKFILEFQINKVGIPNSVNVEHFLEHPYFGQFCTSSAKWWKTNFLGGTQEDWMNWKFFVKIYTWHK